MCVCLAPRLADAGNVCSKLTLGRSRSKAALDLIADDNADYGSIKCWLKNASTAASNCR